MDDYFDLDLLLSVAGGLGRWQERGSSRAYVKDDDCLACLKDLQRFLRRDDPRERPAYMKLGELQSVENDVIPLIVTYPTDTDLVYNALKVLTFMTMPIDLAVISDLLPKQLSIVSSIKEAVSNSRDLIGSLMSLAAGPLSRAQGDGRMSDDDHQVLQLLLTFFRNLVTIPDRPLSGSAVEKGLGSTQDALLALLFDESVMELALLVAGQVEHRRFKEDAPLLLDLLAAVYDGLDVAEVLAASQAAVAAAEQAQRRREAAAARAAAARNRKTIAQQILASKTATTRQGRFKTTLVVSHADSAATTIIRDLNQKHTLTPLGWDIETRVLPPPPRRLSPALLLTFKNFTHSLLQGAFNVLMGVVLAEMSKGHGFSTLLQEGDTTKWFELAAWFTGYVRAQQEELYEQRRRADKSTHKQQQQQTDDGQQQKDQQQQGGGAGGGEAAAPAAAAAATAAEGVGGGAEQPQSSSQSSAFGGVSAALCYEAFRLAHARFMDQVDMSPRSQFKDWPLLHASVLFLRQGLGCLELATRSGAAADRKAAEQLARQLLYDGSREEGLLPAFSRCIKKFSVKHQPRSAAAVLAEGVHALLRLYDRLSARDGGGFRVKKAVAVHSSRAVERPHKQQQQQEATPPPEGAREEEEGPAPPAAAAAAEEHTAADATDAAGVDGSSTATAAAAAAAGGGLLASPVEDTDVAPDAAAAAAACDSVQPQQPQQQQQESRQAGAAATPAAAAGAGGSSSSGGGGVSREASPAAAAAAAAASGDGNSSGAGATDQQQQQEKQQKGSAAAAAAAAKKAPVLEALQQEEGYSENEEDEDQEVHTRKVHEVVLDLNRELRSHYASPSVIHFYCWLLAGVTVGANSQALTHAVASFLWRVVLPEHLDMEPLLYQLSVLRLFHQLLADSALRKQTENKEVLLLATRVVRGLFSKMAPAAGSAAEPPRQQHAAAAAAGGGGEEEAESGSAAGQQQSEAAAAAEREREQRRRAAVSGMLCVELLFWKHPHTCDQIGREYSLREQDRFGDAAQAGGGRRGGKAAAGGGGSEGGRSAKPLLNSAGEALLLSRFEALCGDRSNFDELARQMGGRLKPTDLRREMRRLGLKFGTLPPSLIPQLTSLFHAHADSAAAAADGQLRGAAAADRTAAVAAVTRDVAAELPGGWTDKQVKKLLQAEGLLPGAARRGRNKGGAGSGSSSEDDDAEDMSALSGGDVLLDVPLATLEGLYQKYLMAPDFLDKIAAELSAGDDSAAAPTAADIRATLQHHGLMPAAAAAAKQRGSKQQKRRRQQGAGGGGSVKAGGASAARHVSKSLLAGLWADHGSSGGTDGLNLIAMALGLPVKEVQKLLVKFNINTSGAGADGGSSSDGGSGSDGGNSSGSSDDDGSGSDSGAAARRSRSKHTAGAGPRLPVSAERLRELYQQHCSPTQQRQEAEEGGAAGGSSADQTQQQQREVWLDAIAAELPVPASSSQVLLWLQQAGVVKGTAPPPAAAVAAAAAGGSGRKRLRKAAAAAAADDDDADDDDVMNDELDDVIDDYLATKVTSQKQQQGQQQGQQQEKTKHKGSGSKQQGKKAAAGGAAAGGGGAAAAGGGGDRLAAAAAVAAGGGNGSSSSSSVPEPQPVQLLGYLQALQQAHEESGRWLDAAGAVSWLLGKLDAAEGVWAAAARVAAGAGFTAGAAADYALVPSSEADLDFFCSEWSNEVLEAAGVRNDDDDFFKIPGSSSTAWRQRVRTVLQEALQKLGSSEAAAAADEVMKDAAAAAAAAKAADEAAAAAEQQQLPGAGFAGAGGGRKKKQPAAAAAAGKRKKAGSKAAAAAEQQQQSDGEQEEEEQQQLSDADDADAAGGDKPPAKKRRNGAAAAAAAGRSKGKGSRKRSSAAFTPDSDDEDAAAAVAVGDDSDNAGGAGRGSRQRKKGRTSAAAAGGGGSGSGSDDDEGSGRQQHQHRRVQQLQQHGGAAAVLAGSEEFGLPQPAAAAVGGGVLAGSEEFGVPAAAAAAAGPSGVVVGSEEFGVPAAAAARAGQRAALGEITHQQQQAVRAEPSALLEDSSEEEGADADSGDENATAAGMSSRGGGGKGGRFAGSSGSRLVRHTIIDDDDDD